MNPYVAEIRIFAGNFAPTGWALCQGQIIPISQNTALFSLIGTSYGGDGVSTFALPNLQGSAPMHQGQGNGLSQRVLGETGGEDAVTVVTSEMPNHSHLVNASGAQGDETFPGDNFFAEARSGRALLKPYATTDAPNTAMASSAVGPAGSSQPHNNLQPYLGITFIIALVGVFPPRN
jgi:microcystin-dependent protein